MCSILRAVLKKNDAMYVRFSPEALSVPEGLHGQNATKGHPFTEQPLIAALRFHRQDGRSDESGRFDDCEHLPATV